MQASTKVDAREIKREGSLEIRPHKYKRGYINPLKIGCLHLTKYMSKQQSLF